MPQIQISHYSISELLETQIDQISKLNAEYAQQLRVADDNDLISLLTSNSNTIGFGHLHMTSGNSAELKYLFIHGACRKNSFGSQLIHKIFESAQSKGIEFVNLKTDNSNKAFFVKNGFILVKEPTNARHDPIYYFERPDLSFYLEQIQESKKDPKRSSLIPLNIPSDSHHYKYANEHSFMAFQRSMTAQAQREIAILCNNIANPLFKDPYLRSNLLNLSRRNSQARIKILLEDDKTGAGYHNPIIDLAQKLSSFVEIRAIPNGSSKPNEMITCVDFDAGIYCKNYDSFAGFANFHNHLIAQRLRDNFQQIWQYAKPSMQLRRLSL